MCVCVCVCVCGIISKIVAVGSPLCVCVCVCVRAHVLLPYCSSLCDAVSQRYSERTSALCLEERSYGKAVEYSDLKTWWHLFFFQTPVSSSQLPVSRICLLDIVRNSHKKDFPAMLVVLSLNAVAKENIHVRAKFLLTSCWLGLACEAANQNTSFICVTRLPITDMTYHSNPSYKTQSWRPCHQKRKIWQLKRKSVKRASKAYTLRPKRKSKQVC